MKNYNLIVVVGVFIFSCLTMLGQEIATLKMNKSGVQSYFDTVTNLNEIKSSGIAGEATIEFWASAGGTTVNTPFSTWKLTNLLVGNELFSFEVERDLLRIKKGSNTTTIDLPARNLILNDVWYHFALTFNVANQMNVYRDGVLLRTINDITIADNLYFTKSPDNQLLLAEYRVWNRLRTTEQLRDLRFKTTNLSTSELSNLDRLGLKRAYANNRNILSTIVPLNYMEKIYWGNIVGAGNDFGIITSKIRAKSSEIQIAELLINRDHPFLTTNNLYVIAADGGGVDQDLTNDSKGIALKWIHVKNAKSYSILRKLANSGDLPSRIHLVPSSEVASLSVSESVGYFDITVVPGAIYQYTIVALDDNGDFLTDGTDTGFVFHNGEAEGKVITSLQTAVPNVKVEAT